MQYYQTNICSGVANQNIQVSPTIYSGVYDGRNYYVDFGDVQKVELCDLNNEYGIYGISGKWANISINSSLYIGSTNDLKDRIIREHLGVLEKKEHQNNHLQNAYNKHGQNEFSCFILESCNIQNQFEREQNWLDYYNNTFQHKSLFNITKRVDKPNPPSKEQIEILKERLSKDYIVTFPDGHEEKIRNLSEFCRKNNLDSPNLNAVAMGKIGQYKGFKARFANENKQRFEYKERGKEWIVTHPDGREENVKCLKKFCEENNLSPQNMWKIATGKINTNKGFKCRFASDTKQRYIKKENPCYKNNALKYSKEYIITYPDGSEKLIRGLATFCRENGLNPDGLRSVCAGRISQSQGYKCRYSHETEQKYKKKQMPKWSEERKIRLKGKSQYREYDVIFPTGEILRINSLNKFCKDNNLNNGNMHLVATGKQKEHKGFKCKIVDPVNYSLDRKRIRSGGSKQKYKITLPSGEIEITNHIRNFCSKYNLKKSGLYDVLRKRQDSYKGFKIEKLYEE